MGAIVQRHRCTSPELCGLSLFLSPMKKKPENDNQKGNANKNEIILIFGREIGHEVIGAPS
jgi:hypothetical protein